MPIFKITLACEVSCYDTIGIEANTFAEAVERLQQQCTLFDGCTPAFGHDYDYRIVEAYVGDSCISDDISIDCDTMSIREAVRRLRELAAKDTLSADELRAEATRLADQWDAYRKPDPRAVARADSLLEGEQR